MKIIHSMDDFTCKNPETECFYQFYQSDAPFINCHLLRGIPIGCGQPENLPKNETHSILPKQIPRIDLLDHIADVVRQAIGDDDIGDALEFGQIVHHA